MIQFQNVSKIFGSKTTAVDDVSFQIKEGETFGLIGTSGCGKTTTLKMINRLVEPTSGKILVNGRDSSTQNPEQLRHNIGYVIQDVGLFPHHSVQENVATVPKLLKWNEQKIKNRSNDLLQLVGLNPDTFADRQPDSLSGGQQQRVGLARALAADPPIILMDEPFGALDPITKQRIRREISDLFEEINKTIVLVTHDIVEAFEMCDRLCLLDDGKVQQIGTPKDLLFSPENDFVDSFFASNRFQLELLSIKLSDILTKEEGSVELYWSPPSEKDKDDENTLDGNTSLFTILEDMEQQEHNNPAIIHRVDNRVIDSLSFSDLLNLFQQFKRRIISGGRNG